MPYPCICCGSYIWNHDDECNAGFCDKCIEFAYGSKIKEKENTMAGEARKIAVASYERAEQERRACREVEEAFYDKQPSYEPKHIREWEVPRGVIFKTFWWCPTNYKFSNENI